MKKRILDKHPGMTISPCQLRPESRGSIHIKSSNAEDQPCDKGKLSCGRNDRRTLIEGMKIAKRIASAPALKDFVAKELNPNEEIQSDDELLDFARERGNTVYHPVGTCKWVATPKP
ncbi:MAG: hypothetical protein CM15mP62_07160 [Rhodospirillaceae bacterium]|nr:MAG: hypothetical protein CM15mP62_07160 [Rhodospirillaceae bacterium]